MSHKTASSLNVSYNAISSAIKSLKKIDILVENKKVGRGKTFSYDDYLQILRKDT